jgi:hypothetical protein
MHSSEKKNVLKCKKSKRSCKTPGVEGNKKERLLKQKRKQKAFNCKISPRSLAHARSIRKKRNKQKKKRKNHVRLSAMLNAFFPFARSKMLSGVLCCVGSCHQAQMSWKVHDVS